MTGEKNIAAARVLDLFDDEADLRDYIAANLHLAESGLELLRTEYPLANLDGAGGRIDILARDPFDHLVCIEIKRSDKSARSTLNELSKYVSLLVERDRVPREAIRCLVISTDWHELLLPLSYWAASSGVDIIAFEAIAENGAVRLVPKPLRSLRFLPQLCPEIEVVWFDDASLRDDYVEQLEQRVAHLPFVRMASLLLEGTCDLSSGRSPYAVVHSVWRIAERFYDRIEAVTGEPVGVNWPYFSRGWEAESDAMGWIAELPSEYASKLGWNHGTAESVGNLLSRYAVREIVRLGDWPKLEFINDDERIIKAVLARSPLGGSERPNRHEFSEIATPARAESWRVVVDAFLKFISFEAEWHDQAGSFLSALEGRALEVHLHAFDKKHLFYAIHQAREHPHAALGYFEIVVILDGAFHSAMIGRYEWDGHTCPVDANSMIEAVYGRSVWASLSVLNAVDDRRYEAALPLHGFAPAIDVLTSNDDLDEWRDRSPPGLSAFAQANPDYARQVSQALEKCGSLPTDPTA